MTRAELEALADTRALIDQTDDFRRRGMDGAVASNERVLAGRVPALLDAAEAGMRARDAALEEAARVAEAVDPEKPANWLHARHKIAFAIRSLKGAA